MTTRQYSSRSQQSTLTTAITAGATSITVVSGTGLLGGVTIPSGRTFTLVIDPDTAIEEIVDATAVSTNTFSITRAIDGSSTQDHSAGAVVRHMAIGRDYRDANLHAEATGSYNDGSGSAHTMHGIGAGEGDVVGTAKAQTLTNKTLTTPTINGATITGAITATSATFTSPTISGSPVITGLSSAGMVDSSATPKNYVDSILGSATSAATSAASAATSAASAATSASSASTSASSALTSANSASTSATAAATSATSAAASATAAATSATSAAASATAASTSASSASTSASSASTSASSALTSANSASTSASSALTSANSAATSATAAATSATSAAASATAAATSATSAAASATAAATSATSAAASATAAATSASSASTSASSALTSANSASTSASSAATSASSASTSASSALTSANSASTSATSAATSATSAAASAASANAAASAAPEFRQYASEGSVLNNVPARVAEAETLLKQAVWWIDAAHSSASSQTVKNLGWGGSALDATNGSSTSSDSNDALYLAWDGVNYVYLPGVNGNYLSVPDSAALDITGDIDLRVYVAPDDWTPASNITLLSKRADSGSQKSYLFRLLTTGALNIITSADGSTDTLNKSSTANISFADGTASWVRVTLDVDNGAAGNDVKFYTSTDGTTWTQLGTTVTTAGTTSIFASAAQVEIGSYNSGATGANAGKYFRAQILNGIDGVPVLDVDTSQITSGAATSFTALTGQTVTVNRATSGRKTVCVTNPLWLFGTDDYMEVNNRWLEHTGTNYLYLPGVFGNYASTPDAAALDITGDIDLRVKVAMDDWTPSDTQYFLGKYGTSGNRSYAFGILSDGRLYFAWTTGGVTAITAATATGLGLTDGSTKWVRATLDVDNGASGYDVKFFTSDDGITWTQFGATITGGSTTSIYSGNAVLEVGSVVSGASNPARGKFFRAQVLNGIGGTVAFDANFETGITSNLPTTFTESSANAATVTVNYSGSGYRSAGVLASTYVYPGNPNTFKLSTTSLLDFGLNDSFTLFLSARTWGNGYSSGAGAFIGKKFDSVVTTPGYWIAFDTSGEALTIGDGTGINQATLAARTSGQFTTDVAVRNTIADNIQMFRNATAGTAVTDTRTQSLATTQTFSIGRGGNNTFYIDSEIYSAALWRRALTSTEITALNTYFQGRIGG